MPGAWSVFCCKEECSCLLGIADNGLLVVVSWEKCSLFLSENKLLYSQIGKFRKGFFITLRDRTLRNEDFNGQIEEKRRKERTDVTEGA